MRLQIAHAMFAFAITTSGLCNASSYSTGGTATAGSACAVNGAIQVNSDSMLKCNGTVWVLLESYTTAGVTVPDGQYVQIGDNNAGAPPSADCDSDAERGRMSIDTFWNLLYICNGAARGWDSILLLP